MSVTENGKRFSHSQHSAIPGTAGGCARQRSNFGSLADQTAALWNNPSVCGKGERPTEGLYRQLNAPAQMIGPFYSECIWPKQVPDPLTTWAGEGKKYDPAVYGEREG